MDFFPPSSPDNCQWYLSEEGPGFDWFVLDLIIPMRVQKVKLWKIHAQNLHIL